MSENILKNPYLYYFQDVDEVLHLQEMGDSEPGGLPGGDWHIVEQPGSWEINPVRTSASFVWPEPVISPYDQNVVPSVYHKRYRQGPTSPIATDVMAIEVNHKQAVAKFIQKGVTLHSGQRYYAKMVISEDIRFADSFDPAGEDVPMYVFYRVVLYANGERYVSNWAATGVGREEPISPATIELKAPDSLDVTVVFEVFIPYGNLLGDVYIHSLELLEFPQTWGDFVHIAIEQERPQRGTPGLLERILAGIVGLFNTLLQKLVSWLT